MKKLQVQAKKDFIESLATAKPIDAIAELIWNGFDAGATKVQVFIGRNNVDGVEDIRICDNGYGIDPNAVEEYFGSLGDSWKKHTVKENGRILHGKNGKGRFKAFSLGATVDWNTTFSANGHTVKYTISGNVNALDSFDASDPIRAAGPAMTEVHISNVSHDFRSLDDESALLALAKIFAPYMMEYPGLVLHYNGALVDPKKVQSNRQDYHLGDVEVAPGKRIAVALTIIEWSTKTDKEIHLCDEKGVSLYSLVAGMIRAPGFSYTAYVKTQYFRERDQTNALLLADMDPEIKRIVDVAKGRIRQHFRERTLEKQGKVIERWKEENIYPYEDKTYLDPLEQAERQVFDILAVNVQSYLPSFESADQKAKKFTFRLLAQAVRENPESVQLILTEVLDLKKQEQDELADLLRKTSLSAIISAATVVSNRIDFLVGLENLLFNKDTKKTLLERDQLHKMLDNEAWLFGEDYALAASEARLDTVLGIHLDKLGNREDPIDPAVEGSENDAWRFDLMLQKAVQPRAGEYDYLVVELKRPSKKIDSEVLTQVKKYAMAVARDARFLGVPARWKFVAISTDLDDIAVQEANQRNRPKGLVWEGDNITVWAKSWADVINDARAKLNFFSEQLAYRADNRSAKEYLQKAHSRFIPDSYKSGFKADIESEDNEFGSSSVVEMSD